MNARRLAVPAALATGAALVLLGAAHERTLARFALTDGPAWRHGGAALAAAAVLGAIAMPWLGGGTARSRLAGAARALALAAAAVLLARRLPGTATTELLAVAAEPDPRAWWPALPVAGALGGALVALARASGSGVALAGTAAGGALAAWQAGRDGAWPDPLVPAALLALGAIVLVLLALGTDPRAREDESAAPTSAPGRLQLRRTLPALAAGATGGVLATLLALRLPQVSALLAAPELAPAGRAWALACAGATLGCLPWLRCRGLGPVAALACTFAALAWLVAVLLGSHAPEWLLRHATAALTVLPAAAGAGVALLATSVAGVAGARASWSAFFAGVACALWLVTASADGAGFGPSARRLPLALQPGDAQLLSRALGTHGVTDVILREDGRRVLRRNGQLSAEEELPRLLLRRAGRLSAALAPAAASVAVVGRDSGDLLAGLLATTPARALVVDGDEVRLRLAPELAWEPLQSARGGAPAVQAGVPRTLLLRERGRHDLVVAFAEAGPDRESRDALSTEHFLALRAALSEGGVAVLWLPLHVLAWPDFARVAAGFVRVFPETRVLLASALGDRPLVALAGGRRSLPGAEELDALLAASPSSAGPAGAADVYDVYLCDGWTLERGLREARPVTLADPLPARRRPADPDAVSLRNLRLLAELAEPLDTTSLAARPVDEKEHKRLGAELTARSAALVALLVGRAATLELRAAAPGELSADDRDRLEREERQALLFGWGAAPGHLDVRDALLECANRLVQHGRREAAEALLGEAVTAHDDALLSGLLGGVLLRRGQLEEALARLESAGPRAPADRTVQANLAAARLAAGRDADALAALQAAAEAFGPRGLPPLHEAARALLLGEPGALDHCRRLAAELPAGDPWQSIFARLGAAGAEPPQR